MFEPGNDYRLSQIEDILSQEIDHYYWEIYIEQQFYYIPEYNLYIKR